MDFISENEQEYYEILEDIIMENGEINASERNILNKRKEKYNISDERANEIELIFAKELINDKKYKIASKYLIGLVREYPNNIENKLLLVKVFGKIKKYKKAIKILHSIINSYDDTNDEYWYWLSKLFYKEMNFEKEFKTEKEQNELYNNYKFCLTQAFKLNHDNIDYLKEFLDLYAHSMYDKNIEDLFLLLISKEPNNPENYIKYSKYMRFADADAKKSREMLLYALDLFPDSGLICSELSDLFYILHTKESYQEAANLLERAVELNYHPIICLYSLVEIFTEKLKDKNKAIEYYNKMISIDPSDEYVSEAKKYIDNFNRYGY